MNFITSVVGKGKAEVTAGWTNRATCMCTVACAADFVEDGRLVDAEAIESPRR